jgi:NAD dependent epimerase/dehydratase
MKKILITGGTGFIGSHLAEKCVKKGYKVTVFDRYNPNYNLGNLKDSIFRKKIKFIFGDIRDFDSVNNAIRGQDIVLHLAALIGIPYSYVSPNAYIKTNIEGTYNVLESSKNNKVSKIVITSTSEVYGSARYVPMDEKHPLQPQSPYSASKIAADNLAQSYFFSFDLPVTILRPFNTFGPRQSQRAVIPTIIQQILNNSGGTINLGNTDTTRDFLYVDDTCQAYLDCIKKSKFKGEILNVGNGIEISIKKIAEIVSKILKKKIILKKSKIRIRPKKSEVSRLCASSKKAKNLINWQPEYSGLKGFESGLKKIINWHIKNNLKFNFKDYIV